MKIIILLLAITALTVSSPTDSRVKRHIHGRHSGYVGQRGMEHSGSHSSIHSSHSEGQGHSHHNSESYSTGGHISGGSGHGQSYHTSGVHGSSIGTVGHGGLSNAGIIEQTSIHQVTLGSGGTLGGQMNSGHSIHQGSESFGTHGVHSGSIGAVGYEHGVVTSHTGGHLNNGHSVHQGNVESFGTHGVHSGSIGAVGYEHGVVNTHSGGHLNSGHSVHQGNRESFGTHGVHGGSIGAVGYDQVVATSNMGQSSQLIGQHLGGGHLNSGVIKETSIHQVAHGLGGSSSNGAYITDIDTLVDNISLNRGTHGSGVGQQLHTQVVNSGGLTHGLSGSTGIQQIESHLVGTQHGVMHNAQSSNSHSESHSAHSSSQHSGHHESISGVRGSSHVVHGQRF